MGKVVITRLAALFPTILIILSILFLLTKSIPGDPVLFSMQRGGLATNERDHSISIKTYNQTARNLGLDKPDFYFTISPANIPRSFYELDKAEKNYAEALIHKYGHPATTLDFVSHVSNLINDDSAEQHGAKAILENYPTDLEITLTQMKALESDKNDLDQKLIEELNYLVNNRDKLSYLPKFIWHGFDNQYHDWISSAFKFDLGNSRINGQPAWSKISDALRWTLVINVTAIILAYFSATMLGIYAGWWEGFFDSVTSLILYLFYSIPVFWLTTILVVFFTTPDYGNWTNIFPPVGIWEATQSDSFWKIIKQNAGLFVIPVLVLSTSLMAYLARVVRNSIIEEKNKTYVWHARTKGLSENTILWRHVFRNSCFPLITLFASVLPAALAGSLVVEVICNIPGTGRLLYESIIDQDWPVVLGVVLISSLLTILGILISDLLYRWADPRVKFRPA